MKNRSSRNFRETGQLKALTKEALGTKPATGVERRGLAKIHSLIERAL